MTDMTFNGTLILVIEVSKILQKFWKVDIIVKKKRKKKTSKK